jgi:hypothetical protein
MSLQTYVFHAGEQALQRTRLQAQIDELGHALALPHDLNPTSRELLCVNAAFEGMQSVFDYLLIDYQPSDWAWLPDGIEVPGGIEVVSMFNTNSNAQEIVGMMITAAAIARLTGGMVYSEFFADDLIAPGDIADMVSAIIDEARPQFSGPSKLR